jgi:hypothetical protein
MSGRLRRSVFPKTTLHSTLPEIRSPPFSQSEKMVGFNDVDLESAVSGLGKFEGSLRQAQ